MAIPHTDAYTDGNVGMGIGILIPEAMISKSTISKLASVDGKEILTVSDLVQEMFESLVQFQMAQRDSRPNGSHIRWIMILLFAAFGIVIGTLGFIPYTRIDFGLLVLLGLGGGYAAVLMITWIQTRTPKEMLGRMMSLMMLASTGLFPISQALAGALSKWNLTLVFALPGALVLLMTIWLTFQPELNNFSASLANAGAEV